MRTLADYNPANFAPTAEQVVTIKARQKQVIAICRQTFRSTGFNLHAAPGVPGTFPGVIYERPLMIAKAAMINAGRNLLNHWTDFEIEMAIPWRIHADMMHVPLWIAIGSRMEGQFYRTDMDGTLLSAGLWVPEETEMDTFRGGVISSSDVLNWLGEFGGEMPHVAHPHGTLRARPMSISIAAGAIMFVTPKAVFGKAPYTVGLGVPRPTWARVNSAAIGQIYLRPPSNTAAREYAVPVIVTDANDESDTATWTVTVTAATT